jgi:hypothetical protein
MGLGMKYVDIHILWFYGLLVYLKKFGKFLVIWYIFPHCSILRQEKSGNPALLKTN